MGRGWFKIELAPKGATKWRRKSSTIGGNRPTWVPKIGRDGKDKVAGWVGKHGFQSHT